MDEAGGSYFPLGTNLGWRNGGEPSISNQLEEMGKAGMNWSRIWSNHWDGKNPFWVEGQEKLSEGWMYPSVLNLWDEIVLGAARSGIRFQMVMFHHGPWSGRCELKLERESVELRKRGIFKGTSRVFYKRSGKTIIERVVEICGGKIWAFGIDFGVGAF